MSMTAMLFVSASTAALAVVGFHLGYVIHESAAAALVPTLAGGAGGFGIGWSGLDVARRWRTVPNRT